MFLSWPELGTLRRQLRQGQLPVGCSLAAHIGRIPPRFNLNINRASNHRNKPTAFPIDQTMIGCLDPPGLAKLPAHRSTCNFSYAFAFLRQDKTRWPSPGAAHCSRLPAPAPLIELVAAPARETNFHLLFA